MKLALPLAALGIMALVAAWPTFVEPTPRKLAQEPGDSELLKPRYFSVDEKGQPFSLNAKRAKELEAGAGLFDLDEPEAEMTELDGSWVTLRSNYGRYNRDDRLLHMTGAVRILRDDGTEYHTEEAYADIESGTAWGDVRIVGQGPQGEVAAEGFRMTDRGKTMVFLNRTAATTPGGAPENAPPENAPTTQKPAAQKPAAQTPPSPTGTIPAGAIPAGPLPMEPLSTGQVPAAPVAAVPPPVRPPAAAAQNALTAAPQSGLTAAPQASPPAAAAKPTPQPAPAGWTPPPPKRKPIPPKRGP